MPETQNHERIIRLMTDPGIEIAAAIVENLSKRNLDVFFNPQYGIVIAGRKKGIQPTKADMDTAWAARHEIGLYFALRALSGYSAAELEAQRVMNLCMVNPNKAVARISLD